MGIIGPMPGNDAKAYWRANLRLVSVLMTIWALVSIGAGIIFAEPLNQIRLGGFQLGFWFAQQGSIITFVLLIAVYVWQMARLDRKFGVEEE